MTSGLQLRSDRFKKIFNPNDSTILGKKVLAYALAGDAASQLVLKAVLEEGLDVLSTLDSEDDFQAIVVTQDTAYVVNKEAERNTFNITELHEGTHLAMGSGSQIANYILTKGGDPADAVAAAMTTDLGSGGDIIRWVREDEEYEPMA